MKSVSAAILLSILLSACSTMGEKHYQIANLETKFGSILIWLYEDTPMHREKFIQLANSAYWDDYSFNRVIQDFVIQGGCPDTEEGFSESVHLLAPEFRDNIRHVYGTFAAGRDDNPGKLSAACQFYIVQDKAGIPRLDDNYTAYGFVFEGMDIVETIVRQETDDKDQPLADINLKVRIIELSKTEISNYGFSIPN